MISTDCTRRCADEQRQRDIRDQSRVASAGVQRRVAPLARGANARESVLAQPGMAASMEVGAGSNDVRAGREQRDDVVEHLRDS